MFILPLDSGGDYFVFGQCRELQGEEDGWVVRRSLGLKALSVETKAGRFRLRRGV